MLEHDWVQQDEHLCRLWCANTKSLISWEVHHARIELICLGDVGDLDPVLIKCNKFFDALMELLTVKQGHVEMLTWIVESFKMFLSTESLHLARLAILNHTDSFVDRDTIVEGCGWCLHLNGTVWYDLRRFPASVFGPVDAQHVVGEKASKHQFFSALRFYLANVNHFSGEIRRLKSVRICSLSLHAAEECLREHGLLAHLA